MCRDAIATIPGVTLDVAGLDRLIPPSGMPAWYDSIDVFCCLSRSEAFSSAAADAMALGVPVVSTPVSPMVPFVGEAGYTRLSRDPESIKRTLAGMRDYAQEWRAEATRHARAVARTWSAEIVASTVEARMLAALTGER